MPRARAGSARVPQKFAATAKKNPKQDTRLGFTVLPQFRLAVGRRGIERWDAARPALWCTHREGCANFNVPFRRNSTRTYLYGPAVCCKPDVSDGGIGLALLYPARE
jgi:hypothetical protein